MIDILEVTLPSPDGSGKAVSLDWECLFVWSGISRPEDIHTVMDKMLIESVYLPKGDFINVVVVST